jgi:hypothetical protein
LLDDARYHGVMRACFERIALATAAAPGKHPRPVDAEAAACE